MKDSFSHLCLGPQLYYAGIPHAEPFGIVSLLQKLGGKLTFGFMLNNQVAIVAASLLC